MRSALKTTTKLQNVSLEYHEYVRAHNESYSLLSEMFLQENDDYTHTQ